MTFPVFLCVHMLYGTLMAYTMEKRMRSEGTVLSWPLLWTLLPVALVSTPLGAVLARWAGGWFFHGAFLGDNAIPYERYHLGLMMAVGLAVQAVTVVATCFSIGALSRDARMWARLPWLIALVLLSIVLVSDARHVFVVTGTDQALWGHPAGLLSLAVIGGLFMAWRYARRRLSEPQGNP